MNWLKIGISNWFRKVPEKPNEELFEVQVRFKSRTSKVGGDMSKEDAQKVFINLTKQWKAKGKYFEFNNEVVKKEDIVSIGFWKK